MFTFEDAVILLLLLTDSITFFFFLMGGGGYNAPMPQKKIDRLYTDSQLLTFRDIVRHNKELVTLCFEMIGMSTTKSSLRKALYSPHMLSVRKMNILFMKFSFLFGVYSNRNKNQLLAAHLHKLSKAALEGKRIKANIYFDQYEYSIDDDTFSNI